MGLHLAPLLDALVLSPVDGFEAFGHGERSLCGDDGRELSTSRQQAFGRVNFIDQTEPQSFGCADHLPGEQKFERGGAADEARETLRSTVAGDEPELDLGLTQAGGLTGEPHGAGHGEFASAAQSEAVDERDDRLAAGLDEPKDGLSATGLRRAGGGIRQSEFPDVGTCGERLSTRSGDENDANRWVSRECGEGTFEVVEDLGVERVQNLGAIQCEENDAVLRLAQQRLVGHPVSPIGESACTPDDTIDAMVKGITLVSGISSGGVFDQLSSLLSALGFEPGRGWKDAEGRGAAFLAPLGNLELVTGRAPAVPSLLVEVTQLDQVHAEVRDWILSGLCFGETTDHLSSPEATHWNSRLFTVQLAPELTLGFWESDNPLHGKPVAIEGDLSAEGMRFAVVVARWNAVITDRLLQGALDALYRSGAAKDAIEIVRVPGAWEIPSAARTLAETKKFDAIVTLGVLLRGETAHYEAIYTEVARGIGQSQQETGVPHAFGVLTCETLEQALDRAGLKAGNKGFEAAVAAIEMASIQHKLRSGTKGARL